MGLFAELRHAWTTIDNALYLWDYTAVGPKLLGYEGQHHGITGVALAVPRPGVFLPIVKHVIVLATLAEVSLLGLGPDPDPGASSSLILFQTGMSTYVKGLDITVIASSTKTGRIFFGGRTENELYELIYNRDEGWFSSRCSKVCHTTGTGKALGFSIPGFKPSHSEHVEQIVVDDSRGLLYTLSSKSNIRVFEMKAEGSLPLLITKAASDIYSNLGHIISANDTLNANIKIVSISAIPATEGSKYHLLATTATGYRIYLSATSSTYQWSSRSGGPQSMQAQHVKIPPWTAAPGTVTAHDNSQLQSSLAQPIKTLLGTRLAARYPPGYFFCLGPNPSAPNQSYDQLFISSPDAARLAKPVEAGQPSRTAESAIWLSLGGSRAEDIDVVVPYSAPTSTPVGYGNDLAVQFDKPVPEISILTNNGVHVIRRRRLVDIFAALAREGGGADGFQAEVNNLIRAYGRTETLATALAVACGQGAEVTKNAGSIRVNDPEVLDLARKTFIEYGGKPTTNQNSISDKSVPLIDAVRPSPRHAAIALYLSRLLRSTWKTIIAVQSTTPAGPQITSAVPAKTIRDVQDALSSLQRFFKANKTFIKGLSGPDDLSSTSTKDDEIALKGEHRALHSLVKFTSDTIEGLSFVLVLFEEKVAEITALLPEASRAEFLKLTFEELFTSKKGYDLAKELVKAIVNRNLDKGSNVETIAESLRRKCGSFCSSDDVIIFKAQELLKRAAEGVANADFSRDTLNDSLKLFEKVAHSLPADYLQSAVKQYIALQFYGGAIQLVLKVAEEKDKANDALSWMVEGRPESDSRKAKFDLRSQCYDLVHDVVTAVDQVSEKSPSFVDGQPTEIAKRRDEAYEIISRSGDEAFLTNLYDWYLQQGWYDRLLTTESLFITTYLQRKSSEDMTYADLLWKYYGQTSQFTEAAKIQLSLAKSGFKLSLEKRIAYLSRARANASTYTPGTNRKTKQQLLQDISESLDCAMIQDELLQRLKEDPRLTPDKRTEVLESLDGEILAVNELFNNYADNAGYYDICILIYQVADYRDAAQIKGTWQQQIELVHNKARNDGECQPYEAVGVMVQSMGGKLRLSETTFPVDILLPMLMLYWFHSQREVTGPRWVTDIFIELEVPYERLFEVLENMVFTMTEPPFIGSNRKYLAAEIAYVVAKWYHESERAGTYVFGSESGAARVKEALEALLHEGRAAALDDDTTVTCRAVIARLTELSL